MRAAIRYAVRWRWFLWEQSSRLLRRDLILVRQGVSVVERIGLAETVAALRAELAAAVAAGADEEIQFPVGPVQLEFHVGVTRSADAKGGLRFWVLELGGGGSRATETIQKLTITLESPVDASGERVHVHRGLDEKP
jgi:Trypsin-co-occurring domain 2